MISVCYRNTHTRTHCWPVKRRLSAALLIVSVFLIPVRALAGGGPENVLVVVNGDSPVSLAIANTYVALRDIPQEHVLWLHDIPYPDAISIETFRTRIWKPIRDFISQNRLDDEIDIIAYSADFPTAVNFTADLEDHKLPKLKHHGKEASLTGLTYFARHVESGSPYYLAYNANLYFRRNLAQAPPLPRPLTEEEDRLIQLSEQALKKKNFQTAVTNYQSLVDGFPEHGGLWHKLARSQAARGDDEAAMVALQKAVNNGWSDSMTTRNDRYLQALSNKPAWQPLLTRMEARNGPFQAAHGFSANYEWRGATQPIKVIGSNSLHSHYLAIMLAYTGIQGNSIPEVDNYLTAAKSSDGTRPEGTVYLMLNNNVRSKTRQPLFIQTVKALQQRGHRATTLTRKRSVQDGILPQDKDDVIGVVAGFPKYDWQSSGSKLLPGAIAETLTSYGARFSNHTQTKLTEFLRYGAAGTSGTVYEPFSIQAKFPVPQMHVHYADGSSLAEAFYQSVEAPYQLLIIGDPLARPYARFADVQLISPDPHTPWSGVVTLHPKVIPAPDRPIAQLELWVDGQLIAYAQPDKPFSWDTTGMDDGFHEVRLVALEANPVETRSYTRVAVMLANNGHHLALDPPPPQIVYGEDIDLAGTAIGGVQATLWQGNRKLASAPVDEGRWRLRINSQMPGVGPVTLGVHVTFGDKTVVRSRPLKIEIVPPKPARGAATTRRTDSGKIASTRGKDRLNVSESVKLDGKLRQLRGAQQLTMAGRFTVTRSGFFELVVTGAGEISLTVDHRPLLTKQVMDRKRTLFFPLALERGPHDLKIEFSPADYRPYLLLMLEGDQVASVPEVRVVSNIRKQANTTP